MGVREHCSNSAPPQEARTHRLGVPAKAWGTQEVEGVALSLTDKVVLSQLLVPSR